MCQPRQLIRLVSFVSPKETEIAEILSKLGQKVTAKAKFEESVKNDPATRAAYQALKDMDPELANDFKHVGSEVGICKFPLM